MLKTHTVVAILAAALTLKHGAAAEEKAPQKDAPKAAAEKAGGKGLKAKPAKAAAKGAVMPFPATEKTLANGLKVIVVPTGFPNLVSLQIPVQTGSRNEVEPGKSGFAHFFEHMMFRGTPQLPPDQYNELITRAGARQNAYTADDYTNYHITFAKEDLETMLKIEADRFQNLSYSESAFKTESRAVLGEYNKNSASPVRKIIEVQRDNAYTTHTYKHTGMGFLRDIEDMPNQFGYSRTFFERWYRPEYTTVIVAGDVKPAQVLPLVEKYWSSWKRGDFKVEIPKEPEPKAPVYAHVPWTSPTLPWVTVAFHGPAFGEHSKDSAAVDLMMELGFGSTSELHKRLVEKEQKVDQLIPFFQNTADPSLITIAARVKKTSDTVYVRDAILATFAELRAGKVDAERLKNAKSNARYSLVRSFDNTEQIASTLATFVRFRRSYDTLNNYYATFETLTSEDLLSTAKKLFRDERMVVTTLAKDTLPEEIAKAPKLASLEPSAKPASGTAAKGSVTKGVPLGFVLRKSAVPLLNIKFQFNAGSAHDPKGKEGLAGLAAALIADGGSREKPIDEIKKALFPVAGTLDAQVDKEMTTFTAIIHKDKWPVLRDVALPQLFSPGFREEDFKRLKDQKLNAIKQDLRSSNEEELGKERLQTRIFDGTPYGHVALGTIAGLESITLDDVKSFVKTAYTQGAVTLGLSGDASDEVAEALHLELGKLPVGPAAPTPTGVVGKKPQGLEVEIIEKETRATAISFGHPIEVTRSHPDFVALSVARSWLGEHRSSSSHLYDRIRETRGMNYGDYAYIEAFPRGMFQFFPDPNIARRAQIFEVWIRPVAPENAHFALRIALHELEKLIENGLTEEQFETTRNYLMKNVFVMTATQDQELGYALDSRWYGIDEFTSYVRGKLAKLTRADVNAAIKKHLSAKDLSIVIVTKDAKGLKEKLVTDAPSPIKYDGEKPKELLDEDKVIGSRKLGIKPEAVTITPVDDVFAK